VSARSLTLTDAAAALRDGSATSVELTASCLDAADRLDDQLGTFIVRTPELALEAAQRADADFAAGIDRGPLQGIPFGIKDIFATSDAPTTAQSLVLDPAWGSHGDAPAVARLRAAGAVFVGKTTTMEFAFGLPDPDKPFPVPRNPWNRDHWAGGSSSGNASGVGAGMFFGSLGSDTGGSIRLPSAYCGITGLKPTFGRVPKSRTVPLAWSLDHVGPMCRSARDCAAVLEVIAGHDPSDALCSSEQVEPYAPALDGSLAGVRVGVDRAMASRGIQAPPDPAAVALFEAALTELAAAGAGIVEISIDGWEAMNEAAAAILFCECFAYHKRNLQTRWADYGRFTRQMLTFGAFFTGEDLVRAQRVRRAVRREIDEILTGVDVVASLTAGAGAAKADGLDFVSALGLPVYTPFWNGAGLPALSVPIGFTDAGLPIGMQLGGRAFDEAGVLRAGDAFQQRTDWHLRVPMIASSPLR
jgi:Asp-tRNA(Asn)/Glu-tRNA(Gln) amidotransferase A subunit family amidase